MSTKLRWLAAFALLMLLPLVRVASTYRVFSATADEPVHIASGYDWITRGVYVFDPEHPPLARGLFGLGLRAGGVVSPPPENWQTLQPTWLAAARGMDLLWHNGEYVRNLANARRGNLVFLLLALITIAAWAWRAFGPGVALLAVALFGTLPPVLAHAGLATTDMAVAATLPLALFALERWLEQPTLRRALYLGIAIGLGLVSKLSFGLFFAIGAMVMIVFMRMSRPRVRHLLAIGALAVLVVWTCYCFDLRTFFVGLQWAKAHADRGNIAFFLGDRSDRGWWYYFPVVVALKTPIPFLLLFFFGAVKLIRTHFVWIPVALLISVMPVSLNIGVRHVLALYPMMAIVAAFGVRELSPLPFGERARVRGASYARFAPHPDPLPGGERGLFRAGVLIVLLAWQLIGTSLAHPDYLPWFNEAAGRHPERLLGDSNLDWGQDMLRLSEVAREEKIPHLSFFLFGPAGFDRVPLPPHQPLAPGVPTQGWVAVSETALQIAKPGDFAWLTAHRPVRRVGKSIRLYYIE
ncbi:MAG: ArnT family glycosyltransferase [Thermoanaerobaculia bacterium]